VASIVSAAVGALTSQSRAASGARDPAPDDPTTHGTGRADTAFAAAGKGAWLDTWKAAPPFAAMIAVSKLFGFVRPSRRGRPAMVTMVGIVAAVAAGFTLIV
jgi:hypothetical protein